MNSQKMLLVGDPRICPQVAYVMDWQNYEQVDRLTAVNKYADYKIIICAFKRHRRRYAPVGGGGGYTYLDDICRELDQGYSLKEQLSLFEQRTKCKRLAKRFLSSRCGEWLRRIITIRNPKLLKKLPPLLLKPSELFVRVLQSPSLNMSCSRLENICSIDADGILSGCGGVLPFGQVSEHESLEQVYNSPWARIIKLSSLNGSFCLCNLRKCKDADFTSSQSIRTERYQPNVYPQTLSVSTDPSCNLKCGSCRTSFYTANDKTAQQITTLHQQLSASGWLEKAERLIIAGMGEVFYSQAYRQLLTNLGQRHQINIQSNGLLFNAQNWALLADKYQTINIYISIDAATPATYQKLRGGSYDTLLTNLAMLSNLRQTNEISFFEIAFVVQRDNYQEMAAFVQLGKRLQVDRIFFGRLKNWGTFGKREYCQKSMILPNGVLVRELYDLLQQPLFRDPMVDLREFTQCLAASAKYYDKRCK